jgi:hypothetical protein
MATRNRKSSCVALLAAVAVLITTTAPGPHAEECFCLTNAATGITLRGCEAYKAPTDSTAVCTDPETGVISEQTMSSDWLRIEEGADRCTPCRRISQSEEHQSTYGGEKTVPDSLPGQRKPKVLRRSLPGSPIVTASRIFAGPSKYPPKEFAAYGILAFRSRPSPYDRERHLMFCNAYVATLSHADELEVPRSEQMATVWPLVSDDASDRLNRLRNYAKEICQIAVDNYGLVIAQKAIKDAEFTGKHLSRAGPFLLAWSPATEKGKKDALVLVSDLSDVTTYEQAHERFLAWSRDIESDPALWIGGWNLERLRTYIRNWVDKYGEKSLAVFVR